MSDFNFIFAGGQLVVASSQNKLKRHGGFSLVLSQHRLSLFVWVFGADKQQKQRLKNALLVVKPMNRSLQLVQVGYRSTWVVLSVFQRGDLWAVSVFSS